MYRAKTDVFKNVVQIELANAIGLDRATVCRIINQKQLTTKKIAFCLTKGVDVNANIEDYFDFIELEEV